MTPTRSKGAWVGILFTFLVTWEGIQHTAWHDPIDPPGVITVCIGRTNYDDPNIKAGQKYTNSQCEKFLEEDIPKYIKPLEACINNFDAMPKYRKVAFTSAAYNLGTGRICTSFAPLLNEGKTKEACDKLLLYDRSNGKIIRGLQRRREAEHTLCLMEDK